jgi:hypothetical protein
METIYENLALLPPDLVGFNQYNSDIFERLILETKPSHIIEVGTWKGGSCITMCNAIKKHHLNSKITCVDTWLGALEFFDATRGWLKNDFLKAERNLNLLNGYPMVYFQFLSNIVHTDNQDIVTPLCNTSLIAGRYFKNNNIRAELIYIDGSHDYDDVALDLKYYYDLVPEGGIIFGDDYNHAWGVKPAVDEFISKNNLNLTVEYNNFWIIRK